MPKVLRILNRFNVGGPTYNAAYLTKYLAPEFETILIGGDKEPDEESSSFMTDELGIKPIIIPEIKRSINFKQDKIAYQKIVDIIKEFNPDIVHTHASKAGAIGRLAAINQKVPVIIHTFHGHVFHSYFGNLKTAFYKGIEKYLASRSTRVITISANQNKEITETYKIVSKNKTEVIPLGFDLSKFDKNKDEKRKLFREEWKIKDDEIAIGIVGRLAPIKNHELFLRSFAEVKKNTSKKIKAIIVGDGMEKEFILDLISKLNLTDNTKNNLAESDVILTSWQKNIDIVNAGMDIIALTSKNEGTPVSLIEAQASSKVVIATNVGGVEDIINVNKTGLLAENNNLSDFSKKLNYLVENEQIRDKMSKLGLDYVKNKFHYSRLVEDMRLLYNRLLNRP